MVGAQGFAILTSFRIWNRSRGTLWRQTVRRNLWDFGAFAGMGAALGPWATGWLFDLRNNYDMAFNVAMGMCLISIAAMWLASPRKVRLVAGRVPKN